MIKAILLTAGGALALSACSGSASDQGSSPEASAMPDASGSPVATMGHGTSSASNSATPASETIRTDSPPSIPPMPVPPPPSSQSPLPAAPLSAAEEKTQKGARAVLQTWAHALETRQFGLAWEQFGSPPAGRDAFARWWNRYSTIKVTLGAGEGDAAMGSVFYTAPATVTGVTTAGKPFRLQGDVVVRRVNDVDGATPAQLRWHIGSADLKDVGVR